jgi:hypothetical protein
MKSEKEEVEKREIKMEKEEEEKRDNKGNGRAEKGMETGDVEKR